MHIVGTPSGGHRGERGRRLEAPHHRDRAARAQRGHEPGGQPEHV
jgi:hypothetical protein